MYYPSLNAVSEKSTDSVPLFRINIEKINDALLKDFQTVGLSIQNIKGDDLMDIEKFLDDIQLTTTEKKKIYYIIIELLQNIIKYQVKDHGNKSDFVFIKKENNGQIIITTSNYIENISDNKDNIEEIRKRMDVLNNIDLKQLKEAHREMLVKGELSEKGGAGIGLISIARKIKEMDPEVTKIFDYTIKPTEIKNVSKLTITTAFSSKTKELYSYAEKIN